MEQYDNELKKELITKIIKFVKSEEGNFLLHMIKSTQQNRVNDLTYSNKDDIFSLQGEVRAYNDLISFLSEESLTVLREQFNDRTV